MTTPTSPSRIGILVVGLGGNNGVTLVAGHIANNLGLEWESAAAGRVRAPNWNGCITQLEPRGGGVGYKGRFDLADAANAAIGGWDIRPTPLGDALYESRVLDYDLVRQVRDEMNAMTIMKGIYDASFLGESQHETATHVVKDEPTLFEQVQHIRNDIRAFIREKEVDGHTTVIWSASVERPSDVEFPDAFTLLKVILKNDTRYDVSPSMIYAVASAMEGCSFVNGGSQNTVSKAMCELYDCSYRIMQPSATLKRFPEVSVRSAYILGTDFKAGQTKFKTAAVEYTRALGLTPRVIASSNHLGNNDMLNLTSKKTIEAKMRVKKDIFGPWQETDLDHQVRVMYTPFMGDEKRDVVEYTSLGFLSCPHTMLTYTRCMDSVLCVPLMVDVAVWCDYFARHDITSDKVARATAYLFKVPEGGAKGVDPGFHHQMQQLEAMLHETANEETSETVTRLSKFLTLAKEKGIVSAEQVNALVGLASQPPPQQTELKARDFT